MNNLNKTEDGKIIFKLINPDVHRVTDWSVEPLCPVCGPLEDNQVVFADCSCEGKPETWYMPFCVCGKQLPNQQPLETVNSKPQY